MPVDARRDAKAAKKLITADTFSNSFAPRLSAGSAIPGGFGSVLPRHPETNSERMLESTAMASWR